MEQIVEKYLKEIFKDFNFNSNILNSKIQCINLYKKTNRLEIKIKIDKPVKIKDIGAFEKYLIKRFLLKEIVVKVEYEKELENDFISQWEDILDYLSFKHPLTKALLKDSNLKVEENKISIALAYSGSDILYAQKMDETLSDIIERIFNKKYKVIYKDNESEEIKQSFHESTKKMQDELIMQFQNKTNNENEESENKNKKKQNENQSGNVVETKEQPKESEKAEEPENTPLILGRNQNIKEPLTKVIDISIDSGKIALEGEIINTDSRELKNGKFLFMFDLYDGSSTITCKAFIESERFKSVADRIKNAKGVKIGGTAQFDPFAKELRSNCKYNC